MTSDERRSEQMSFEDSPDVSEAMVVDGVLNRAFEELDRLAVSLKAMKTNGGEPSLTESSSSKGVSFQAEHLPVTASTPPSQLRAWIIGDYNAEMITALSSLGVAPGNIRSWNNMRSSDGPGYRS